MNWMKYRFIYFAVSASVIGAGIIGLISWGLNFGVDFKGGASLEYKFEKSISTDNIQRTIEDKGIEITSIQDISGGAYLIKLRSISQEERQDIKAVLEESSQGAVEELKFENVGPSIGPELVKKTFYALAIAAGGILLWVSLQFKSLKFGVSAILATLHDILVLLGGFAILGHFFGAEIDFLFVTAALTILSFSVHDTIVVYDRIRESQKRLGGSLYDLANKAITQTMVRSLNNSFTIIFMLVALVLLGGVSIKWFAIALLIGTVSGTYSSPFVAVPLLVTWEEIQKKLKKS